MRASPSSERRTSHNKHSRSPKGSTPRGFTQIELLAVLAILAVLAVLLIPAGNAVIQRSHSAGCLSNLRELGLAYRTYMTERGSMATPPDLNTWLWFADPNKSPQHGGLRSYLRNADKVLLCPAAKKGPTDMSLWYAPAASDEAWIYPDENARGSYCINNAVQQAPSFYPGDANTKNYQSALSLPSDTPLFMDGAWVDVFPWGFNYQFPPLKQMAERWGNLQRVFLDRHGSKFTQMVFVDGHAEAVPYDKFYDLQWYPTFQKRVIQSPY